MTILEQVRACADGRATASDADLAELVEAYRWTAPPPLPACPVRFSDIRFPSRRRPVAALAAAALIAAAVFALLPDEPPPLHLRSIPLAAVEPVAPSWPPVLARYGPADENGLRWQQSMDEARALARCLDRPILVFMDFRQGSLRCPLCAALERGAFREEAVARAAEPFVLLRLDYLTTPPPLGRVAFRSWPGFHVLDAEGKRLFSFSGCFDARTAIQAFERAWEKAQRHAKFEPADWRRLRDLASGFERGEFASVAAADPEGEFGRAARSRLLAAAQAALAARSPEAIDEAILRQKGSPYVEDLRRVRRHIETYGTFPNLE